MSPIRVLILAPALLLLSCSQGYRSPSDKLAMAVTRYNDAVRWRNYNVAAEYVPAERREQYLADRRAMHDDTLKILEYEIGDVRHLDEIGRAEVMVTFSYNPPSSNMVERATFQQDWRYGKNRAWTIEGQARVEKSRKEPKLEDRF